LCYCQLTLFAMKLFATLLLSLSLQWTFAQTRVIWQKNLEKEGLDVVKLAQQYNSDGAGYSKPILDQVEKAVTTAFPAHINPGIGIFTQFFVNASGSVDYLIFQLQTGEGYNMDSLSQHITAAFLKSFDGWKAPSTSGKSFMVATFRNVGKPFVKREVRKMDSSIVDLKTAAAAIDTLKIKYLYLNQLELKEVPKVIYRFSNLEELYLGGNELQTAAIDLKRFPKLKQLHLQGNQLTNSSLVLTASSSLQMLNLKENKFTDIPQAARKCKKLGSLWLGGNVLSDLSSRSFSGLKQVRDLNFYHSDITVLPKGIKKMRKLEVLDLYYNKLEELPNSIVKLRRLTHFAVSYNQIAALPARMDKLQNVHTLYAHHNHLSKLPARIVKMKNLNILDLGYNWFTNFPAELTAFTNLQELDLSSNNFPEFPDELLKIGQLDKLYLRGNPFVKENVEQKYGQQLGLLKSRNIEVFY
jgi:Leucine-rich repeat (LRR) protein